MSLCNCMESINWTELNWIISLQSSVTVETRLASVYNTHVRRSQSIIPRYTRTIHARRDKTYVNHVTLNRCVLSCRCTLLATGAIVLSTCSPSSRYWAATSSPLRRSWSWRWPSHASVCPGSIESSISLGLRGPGACAPESVQARLRLGVFLVVRRRQRLDIQRQSARMMPRRTGA